MYGIRWAINYGVRLNSAGLYHKYEIMFHEKHKYNLLFIGSSRAQCHFDPLIIDSVLGTNSFNCGVAGSNNGLTYGILKAYLHKNKLPQSIVMNLDYHFAHHSSDTIFNEQDFIPYIDNPVLYRELKKRNKTFFYYKYFPFVSLPVMGDKFLNNAMRGYLDTKSAYQKASYKGNERIIALEYADFNTLDSSRYMGNILKENIDYLDSVRLFCQKNKIHLTFVISPCHITGTRRIINYKEQIASFHNYASHYRIPLMDYSMDTMSFNKEYFADYYHLKGWACDVFSRKFVTDYAALLNPPKIEERQMKKQRRQKN
jgi:hypothetical protein